jgi:hypothetical protein
MDRIETYAFDDSFISQITNKMGLQKILFVAAGTCLPSRLLAAIRGFLPRRFQATTGDAHADTETDVRDGPKRLDMYIRSVIKIGSGIL